MTESELAKASPMSVMNVERLPSVQQSDIAEMNYKKYPLANMSSLGVSFKPLFLAVQNISGSGGSGFYYVDTAGKQMFRSSGGFIGSLKSVRGSVGGGQARMTTIPCDPTMLFMSMALMTIEKKLDALQEIQQDIVDYLKSKEKARILGNINTLTDVLTNYKFNWDNDKYKTNKHILVQDIRKDAEQSLILCCDQIKRLLSKNSFIHSDEEVKLKIKKLQSDFETYQQALYQYSYAAFIEIMLLENFDSQYLRSAADKIGEYALNYSELYTNCYEQLEGFSQGSVQSFLTKGLASASKGAGSLIAKIPLVSKGPVDEALISAGEKLEKINDKKIQNIMTSLASGALKGSSIFIENIKEVDMIYNRPSEILFDSENLYIISE